MSEEFSNLDERLAKADPATETVKLDQSVLVRATKSKPKVSRRTKYVASLSSGLAAIAAVLVFSTAGLIGGGSPLFTLAGTQQATALSGAESADSKLAIWNPVNYVYEASPKLSNSGSAGHVYQLKPIRFNSTYIHSIADSLELEGDIVPVAEGFGVGGDGAGNWAEGKPSLWFYNSAGSWYYQNDSAYPKWICDEVSAKDNGSKEPAKDPCREVPVDKSLAKPWPTKAEAIDYMKSMVGEDLARFDDIEYQFSNEYQPVLYAVAKVDSETTQISFNLTWSKDGILASANGYHFQLIDRGNFSTISAVAAVKRLGDYRYTGVSLPSRFYVNGMMYGMPMLKSGVADTAASASVGGEAADASSSEGSANPAAEASEESTGENSEPQPSSEPEATEEAEPTTEPEPEPSQQPSEQPTAEPAPQPSATEEPSSEPTEPAPVEPTEAPEPLPAPSPSTVTLVIDRAELTISTVFDADNNMWLVPAWVMYSDDQMVAGVLALQDGVIELPEYMPMVGIAVD